MTMGTAAVAQPVDATTERRKRWPVDGFALAALAFTLLAWAALLSPDYFMGAHDAHHSLFFPLQFEAGLRAGDWLPRWGADFAHGYGYPIFVFYAPLTFYLWAGIHLTGIAGTVATTKIVFALGFLLAAAGIYHYAWSLWRRRAVALLAAAVYTLLPYHLLNVYVRAAFAEFMAMALLPWIALAFRRLIQRPTPQHLAFAALSYGALLWTHNITALTFTPLLALLIVAELWLNRGRGAAGLWRRSWPVGVSLGLAVALGTAVWLPGLSEQADIAIEQWSLQSYQYADHFVYPWQLLDPTWGYGYSSPGATDGMSFQLGIVPLALALFALFVARRREREAAARHWALLFAIALAIYVLLMMPISKPFWDLGPLSTLIQFPWRLLAVIALPLSLLAGYAARGMAARETLSPALLIALLALVVTTWGYALPQATPPNPRDETQQTWRDYEATYPDMVGMVAQTEIQPADSPLLAALQANELPQRFQALDAGTVVTQIEQQGSRARARVQSEGPTTLRYLSYDYPGWRATVDGVPTAIRREAPLGLMLIELPAGTHEVTVEFGNTPMRSLAELLSLLALVAIVGVAAVGWRRAAA